MERVDMTPTASPTASEKEIVRFDRHQIIQHVVLLVTFILLAVTGLPMKFNEWGISQWWIEVWGGIDVMRSVHRFAAWVMILDCIYHVVYLGYTILVLKRPLPVRMIPAVKDFQDFFQELGYFVGLTKEKPRFDRFNWREKFDYWAIFWGMPVMGATGFIMAYPVFMTRFLPGWIVPAAFVAHSDEAVLAVTWIVVVHFVFNHLAPGVFPFNSSIFTGRVAKERYRRDHPLEYERLPGVEEAPREELVPEVPEPVPTPTTALADSPPGLATQESLVTTSEEAQEMPAGANDSARYPGSKGRSAWRELFSDAVVATGAALMLFSIGLVILVLFAALPGGNPYIGMFLFVLLPVLALGGFLVFFFGVLLEGRRGSSTEENAGTDNGQSQMEDSHS